MNVTDFTNSELEKALADYEERIKLTTSLKENNWSRFSDETVNRMHSNYIQVKSDIVNELNNRGVLQHTTN